MIYGALWVAAGLFGSGAFVTLAHAFPPAILGAVLVFEAAVLVLLLRDQRAAPAGLALAAVVALMCCFAPQGYLAGLVAGVAGFHALRAAGVRFSVVMA